MEKHLVGIDVDKATIKACLLKQASDLSRKIVGSKTFSNQKAGFVDFLKWVAKHFEKEVPVSFVMEATGVYHEQLAYCLHEHGHTVHIVLPLKSKRYIQSLGIRSKTDKIDARGLAMMGIEQQLDIWQPGSSQLLKLRSLTRQIEQLQKHKTAFKNQLEGAKHTVVMHKSVILSLERMIKQLDKEVEKLEKQVEEMVLGDAFLCQKFALLKPLVGVGLMSFAVVVGETNGFTLFNNQRQLVCYSGYDVLENQSGQRTGKTRISKKGNSHIRRILHMASLSVVKHKVHPFHSLFQRVHERSGVKMKGYVAVQRKLLVMMYTLWKTDKLFDPDYGISGNHEPKTLFSVAPAGASKKTAESYDPAALDGLQCNQSPEALFSVM